MRVGRDSVAGLRRIAVLLKRMAYGLAAVGLFIWFVLDEPLIGIVLLMVAFGDGCASVLMNRKVSRQWSGNS